MDDRRFDHLTRVLATVLPRRALTSAGLGAVVASATGRGWELTAAKKRRKKKRKKKPGTSCATDCPGNQSCLPSGECGCANGTKLCPGDVFNLCHECCPGAGGGLFAPDCNDSLGGEHCLNNGANIYRCGCLETQQTCGDGECVACCSHQHCRDLAQDDHRICVGGTCPCDETQGWFECPDGSFHEGRCRHTSDDNDACGKDFCDRCDPPRSICGGGTCCFPSGQSCEGNHRGCCSGEDKCGFGFICA